MQQLAGEGCDKKTISTMASDLMFGGEPENHVSLDSHLQNINHFAREQDLGKEKSPKHVISFQN